MKVRSETALRPDAETEFDPLFAAYATVAPIPAAANTITRIGIRMRSMPDRGCVAA